MKLATTIQYYYIDHTHEIYFLYNPTRTIPIDWLKSPNKNFTANTDTNYDYTPPHSKNSDIHRYIYELTKYIYH